MSSVVNQFQDVFSKWEKRGNKSFSERKSNPQGNHTEGWGKNGVHITSGQKYQRQRNKERYSKKHRFKEDSVPKNVCKSKHARYFFVQLFCSELFQR